MTRDSSDSGRALPCTQSVGKRRSATDGSFLKIDVRYTESAPSNLISRYRTIGLQAVLAATSAQKTRSAESD